MPKPTKAELNKYKGLLTHQLSVLRGDVGSMRDEALRASEQDASVDHLADQGTDNYDQSFMLGLIENEEETIQHIEEALDRMAEDSDLPYGACAACWEEYDRGEIKKTEVWVPRERLEYVPWARYCIRHQEQAEQGREIA